MFEKCRKNQHLAAGENCIHKMWGGGGVWCGKYAGDYGIGVWGGCVRDNEKSI